MLVTLPTTVSEPFIRSEETVNRQIIVQAAYTNSDYVYLSFGDQHMSTTDYALQLKAGDAVIVSDLKSHLYAVGGAASQKLTRAYYESNENINRRVS